MEYIPFALKYRPKNFDEVIGQKHIVDSLKSAILKKHIHHAYLFSGPRGIGKTSLARIFAKSLNCFSGPTIIPCEKCISCLEINRATAMDVIEIDGASNRGIDEIRVLRENVKLSPTYSRYKIYIIDEVHMLSQDAFNALLKTLEEPPSHVKFIFATTHIQKVLPTILSRCQRFQFTLPTLEEIVKKLKKIVSIENLNVTDNLLYAIARSAEGSIRDAESLLDKITPIILEKEIDKEIFSFLGLIDEELLNKMLKTIVSEDITSVLNIIEEITNSGKDIGIFLNAFISHLRNVLLAKLAPEIFKKISDISQETKNFIFEISTSISPSEILKLLDLLICAREQSSKLNTVRIPFELAIIKFLYKEDKTRNHNNTVIENNTSQNIKQNESFLQEVKESLDLEIDDVETIQKNTTNENEKIEPEVNDNLILTEVKTKWQEILLYMQKKKAAVASCLSFAELLSSNGNVLVIGFSKKYNFHKDTLENIKNLKFIEETISKFLNRQIYVKFVFSPESSLDTPTETKDKTDKAIDTKNSTEAIEQNEFLNDILDTFGGNICTE